MAKDIEVYTLKEITLHVTRRTYIMDKERKLSVPYQ